VAIACVRCGDPAVAVFLFSAGCYCDPSKLQSLCLHHAMKSGPPPGESMQLVEDLSEGGAFGRWWSSCERSFACPRFDHRSASG
jgi:hypothetical protein